MSDEVQALQQELAAFRLALTGPQQERLAAVDEACSQRMDFVRPAAASRLLETFARASAAVDQCALPGPGASDLCIAPGGPSELPEVTAALPLYAQVVDAHPQRRCPP